MTVLLSDPGAENSLFASELEAAARRVLASGVYVLGPEVAAFESEFAAFVGAGLAVGTASGTDALTLALAAVGVQAGDDVVTVGHTSGATVAAIIRTGARPVLVDVEREALTMSPEGLELALTNRTRAIVPVHIYGGAADLDSIRKLADRVGVAVVEDCCQAHGTQYRGVHVGSQSHAAAFSFYPTKNLGALGDGGAVVTSEPEVAERVRLLRQYGWRTPQVSEVLGWNSRLDELQAALLRVKLRHLPELLRRRCAIAAIYTRSITRRDVTTPIVRPDSTHSFHQYVIRSSQRDRLRTYLSGQGIDTGVHYPLPVHRQPAYAGLCMFGALEETDRAATEILSLPLSSSLAHAEVKKVVAAVNEFSRTIEAVTG